MRLTTDPLVQHDLLSDRSFLADLRMQLLLIRLWGTMRESCRPTFTKTAAESFDVIAKVFALLTKYAQNANDDTLIGETISITTFKAQNYNFCLLSDDCLRLPSQLMLPDHHGNLLAHGVAPAVVNASQPSLILLEFGLDTDFDAMVPYLSCMVNTVRQAYLGRNTIYLKQCAWLALQQRRNLLTL